MSLKAKIHKPKTRGENGDHCDGRTFGRRLPACVVCVLFLFAAAALQARGQAQGTGAPGVTGTDAPSVTIPQMAWADDGGLVLAVLIHASASRDMELGRLDFKAHIAKPFSMGDSYLIDGYTGVKINALSDIPVKPYFAPMAVTTHILRGGQMKMGAAFPAPPVPPLSRDGKPQPYKLTLYTPLTGAKPIQLTLPPRQ